MLILFNRMSIEMSTNFLIDFLCKEYKVMHEVSKHQLCQKVYGRYKVTMRKFQLKRIQKNQN